MENLAARQGDMHTCPKQHWFWAHEGGEIQEPCGEDVIVGGRPQARISDLATCEHSGPDVVVAGAATVLIQGLPAARKADKSAHGGEISSGLSSVCIGGPTQVSRPIEQVFSWWRLEWQYRYGSSIHISQDDEDPTYQGRTLAALVRLDTTSTIRKAIDALEASGHVFEIIPFTPQPGMDPDNAFNAYCQPEGRGWRRRGEGSDSTIGWSPGVHGFGPPGKTPDSCQPGSDIILGHEMIHGAHNATGEGRAGPANWQHVAVSEERNTVGLPASVYRYPGKPYDPLNGRVLPDTTSGRYTENALRAEYAQRGIPSPVTGKPPLQRPSYYRPLPDGSAGLPF